MDKTRTQITVAIVASVLFVLALTAGKTDYHTPLRLYSIAVPVVTYAFIAYDRFIWRLKWVRKFTKRPLLAGSWRGTLVSDYKKPDGSGIPPIPTSLYITQTNSTLTVTLFTGESSSVSEQAKLSHEADGRWRLHWLYENKPKATVRHRSDRHEGVAELYLVFPGGEELEGEYFTDRNTKGTFSFDEWSKRPYGSAESAHNGGDFEKPHPFVA